ncbi:hypothetical protein F5X68DRAFT_13509 [Plectosphaerella plurivora]|uniref:Secreted protein n=1 Tax=Plectosphaerella plurivora TaxID=936078 RepID=A0A9P8VBP6_9PEZI|nr:hypothetical protein F5X68DRAFT_13509 [Plectosphaerella plurivora]
MLLLYLMTCHCLPSRVMSSCMPLPDRRPSSYPCLAGHGPAWPVRRRANGRKSNNESISHRLPRAPPPPPKLDRRQPALVHCVEYLRRPIPLLPRGGTNCQSCPDSGPVPRAIVPPVLGHPRDRRGEGRWRWRWRRGEPWLCSVGRVGPLLFPAVLDAGWPRFHQRRPVRLHRTCASKNSHTETSASRWINDLPVRGLGTRWSSSVTSGQGGTQSLASDLFRFPFSLALSTRLFRGWPSSSVCV